MESIQISEQKKKKKLNVTQRLYVHVTKTRNQSKINSVTSDLNDKFLPSIIILAYIIIMMSTNQNKRLKK